MTTPFDDLLPELPKKVTLAAKDCWEACKDSKIGHLMSHVHHDTWLERLNEPIENRIRYILLYKDPKERVQRLRRLRPFDTRKATPECKKALAACDKADTALDKALALAACNKAAKLITYTQADAYNKALAALDKALDFVNKSGDSYDKAGFSPEMLKVHAQVCGCPWSKNKDIFGIKY